MALDGNTYGIRAELKALGAVWDSAGRVWRIALEKAAQAQALMDSQPQEVREPAAHSGYGSSSDAAAALDDLPDPFEEVPEPMVALTGNSFAVKDALRAGAGRALGQGAEGVGDQTGQGRSRSGAD